MEPEAKARLEIDKMLEESGWIIQDRDETELSAGRGVAIREYPLGQLEADYVLFIDFNPVGVVEAKKQGWTLTGVEGQSKNYLVELKAKFPDAPIPPCFAYETSGVQTQFTDYRDPDYRSRDIFSFHRPELLAEWLKKEKTLRARLKEIPMLDYDGLRYCQENAIMNLEKSFSENNPRAIIQMSQGSGKTFAAVTACYRLIKFGDAKRILFLVDRGNLGKQTKKEFQAYQTPDDHRKFTDLYNIQRLESNKISDDSAVVISTIQRMYSILKGDKEFDVENEEFSEFESEQDNQSCFCGCKEFVKNLDKNTTDCMNCNHDKQKHGEEIEIDYNKDIPIGTFDFIIIDECHRSIFKKWRNVVEYFDSFLIGLTATLSNQAIGFFNENIVSLYPHERAVADKVNVNYEIYRIKTKITEEGATIEAGEIVIKRDKLTRAQRTEQIIEDYPYDPAQLDNEVVTPSQIRLVLKTFKEKTIPEVFPDRRIVPKTLIFAKDDNHAEEITKIAREVFGKGNEFCQKITYKTTGAKPEDILQDFRTSLNPRIAVTVDMIATGTDVRPLEVVFFMRDVKSKNYFEQMKGRGMRVIEPNDLVQVTPDAKSKDRFLIVDAVGVTESIKTETYSLDRKKGVSFETLLEKTAERRINEDELQSLAYRLSRLNQKLEEKDRTEIASAANGQTISQMIHKILDGINPDNQVNKAKEKFQTEEPSEEQIEEVSKEMVRETCRLFDSAKLRKTILDIKKKNEIIIDETSIDELIQAGFDEQAEAKSKETIDSFKKFLDKNKDEITALQIIYSQKRKLKEITFEHIKELANALEMPPSNLTPEQLWAAYMKLEKSKVKNNPVKILTDLISIVRYSTGSQDMLIPFKELVDEKFEKWMSNQESSGKQFTPEQKQWLVMIKGHIAGSAEIKLDDMDYAPFNQKGGRVKFYETFGEEYESILKEMHEVLVSA